MIGERYQADQFIETEPRVIAGFEAYDDQLIIHDPVWGTGHIGGEVGDKVFLDLLHNPLVRRSVAIEQLTLNPTMATIPATGNFSRWEHIWGSVVLTRYLTEGGKLSDAEKLQLQLRTFVSDLGHTAYSHLGDWLFQAGQSGEDQHDIELAHLLEVSGANDTLRQNGINPIEVTFPPVEDWVERPAPDLCVDRVDYGAREINRWLLDGFERVGHVDKEWFQLADGQLVITSKRRALAFSKAYLLLASENWCEPVHRLQLKLQEEQVKHVFHHPYSSLIPFGSTNSAHPRDLFYTIDSDITSQSRVVGTFNGLIRPIMHDIGQSKRRIFVTERKAQLASFTRDDTDRYPNPLEHYNEYARKYGLIPLVPSVVSIIPVQSPSEVVDFGSNPYTVDFLLTPLKPRQVDPLFITERGELQRLSEADANFASLLDQQRAILAQGYVGRLHMNEASADALREGITKNELAWQQALQRPRMSADVFKQVLETSADFAEYNQMVNMRRYH